MECVGAGFGDHVDDAAADAAELHLVVVGVHFELLNVVHDRRYGVIAGDRHLVVDSIHQKEIGAIARAVEGWEVERAHAAEAERLSRIDRTRARRKGQQLGEVAAVQRQVVYRCGSDDGAQLGRGAFNRGSDCRYRDGLFGGPHVECHIVGRGLIHRQHDTALQGRLKSRLADAEVVSTRLDVNHRVLACAVGAGHHIDASRYVMQREGGAGNRSAR